jgi:hypothetical protein
MTDRPILMSGPMIKAIQTGQKTQTRRVIRVDRYAEHLRGYSCTGRLVPYGGGTRHGAEFVHDERGLWHETDNPDGKSSWVIPVHYLPLDRLWVREAFTGVGSVDPQWTLYRADGYEAECARHGFDNVPPESEVRWKPSIHMPRALSRMTLVVLSVEIERLQDITESNARAEGIPNAAYAVSPRQSFRRLWNGLAQPGFGWDDNPWVVAIGFQQFNVNVDRM